MFESFASHYNFQTALYRATENCAFAYYACGYECASYARYTRTLYAPFENAKKRAYTTRNNTITGFSLNRAMNLGLW